MGGLILRPAEARDVPALAALGRDSFVAKFGHLYRNEDLAAFLEQVYAEPVIAAEAADPQRRFQLAESNGRLLGYCKLGFASSWPEHARGSKAIELKQLYTAPDATGRGIGKALTEWALGEARALGADEVHLSVFNENHGAQRFYRRFGFEKVADITFNVGDHVDHEFLFALRL